MLCPSYRVLVGASLLVLAACPTRDISQLDMSPAIEVRKEIPVKTNRNVDILFVIDNSDSMKEEQDSLAANFPKFVDVMNAIPGGLPNVHIAVVSSDVGVDPYIQDACHGNGDDGVFQNTPHGSCSGPTGRFIEDVRTSAGHVTNYSGKLEDAFSCIARLGTSGCGFEQHLESMKRALDGSQPLNAGFLRQDAYLAVIIIGDEDDCSARDHGVFDPNPQLDNINSSIGVNASYRCTEFGVLCDGQPLPRVAADYRVCVPRGDSYLYHPQKYYDFLRNLKQDPNLLIGAVIAGNPAPFGVKINQLGAPETKHSCQSANGVADPAIRLKYFVDQFGLHGQFVSICQADLTDALVRIGQLLATVIGTPCLEGNIDPTDIDPSQVGLQIDCQVSDVRFPGQASSTEIVLPRCAMKDATTPSTDKVPCWWTNVDATACTLEKQNSPTHVALHVERGGVDAPIGTSVVAKCVSP